MVDTTGHPLVSAEIAVAATRQSTTSDSLGKFQILHLAPGATHFSVRRLGYYPGDFDVLMPRDSALVVSIHLTPAVTTVDSITTTAARGDAFATGLETVGFLERMEQRRRGAGSSTFITVEDIARRRPNHPSDLLLTVSGVRMQYQNDSAVPFGPGQCLMNIWVDGHYMNDIIYNQTSQNGTKFSRGGGAPAAIVPRRGGLDAVVHPEEIAGIEIYPSASEVPHQYDVMANGCGAIIIWTK